MPMEIAVVGDEHFVMGFHIAGVRQGFVADRKSITKTLEDVLDRKDLAIVIMNNEGFSSLSDRLKERAQTQVRPTVVVLSHDVSAEENLRLLIKRSLGIDLWAQQGEREQGG